VSEALISQVDLMATLAAAAGAEVPAGAAHDSYDLLPVWTSNAASPRRTIVHNTFQDAYAIRHEHWVLIARPTGAHTRVPEWVAQARGYSKNQYAGELFDLSRDLGQKNNLYGAEPGRVAELSRLLAEVRRQGQVR
jgi:arylsulfatase A-like enzyme